MTAPDVDPFAEDPIQRDRWDRPKIIPVGRGGKPNLKAKLVPYTRVSTLAGALDEVGGLLKWSLWHLALGLGRNPDLAALAGVFGPTVDDLSRYDKQALDAIIERAHDRSGGNVKADYGTVVHAYTEPGAQTVADPFGPNPASNEAAFADLAASLRADVAAYQKAMDDYGLEVIDTEQFVVNDEVQAAGTYDHKVRFTRDLTFGEGDDAVTVPAGTVVILDKKTGKLHLDSQSIQLATYAHARTYVPETGERGDLGASLEYGILAHIPKSGGKADLHLIDLRIGWAATKLAEKAREHRTRKDIGRPFPSLAVAPPVEAGDTVLGLPVIVDDGFPADTVSIVNDGATVAVVEVEPGDFTSTTDANGDEWPTVVEQAVAAVDEFAQAAAAVTATPPRADPWDDVALEPTPEPIAEPETTEDAVANLAGAGLVDEIHADIFKAKTRLELKAVWSKHKADWTPEHTALVEGRLVDMAA